METSPLVSIITPTFNRAVYLPHAVDSVLGQTYPHFEHWIVDDGSTDETADVVNPYLADFRIRYVRQDNKGQSHARNRALKLSKGQFICFLDSDDCWFPHKLERSLEEFRAHPWAHVVYGDYQFIDAEGKPLPIKNMPRFSGRIVPWMLRDNCVSMNTTMARRECFEQLGGFSGKRRFADDYDLWLRFSAYFRFLYLPEILGCYRIMESQLSTNKLERIKANEEIIMDFLKNHGHRVTAQEKRMGLCRFYTRKGRILATQGQHASALGIYVKAIGHAPTDRAPWRALAKLLIRGTG